MPLNLRDVLWYGTRASLDQAIRLDEAAAHIEASSPAHAEEDGPKQDYLLDVQGPIGTISIKGPLVNADNWITQLLGMSTYPAIRRALVSAAQNQDIRQILLDVDSGGGAVAGVDDTAQLIKQINAKVKPVTTFADGMMASAAYWLGSTASKVYASKTSMIGSIGVLTTHIDRTQQLANEGIKATVLRAGKYKALANPLEPLSEAAREQIQAQLDAAYQIFVQHVADSRGVSYATADQKMAQGREFFGAAALDAGLLDGISSFDAVMSQLTKSASVDKRRPLYDNGINFKGEVMPKAALTEQTIAALAEGAVLEPVADPAKPAAAAVVEDPAKPAVDPAKPAAAVVEDPAKPAAVVEPAKPAASESGELVKFLQNQVKEKDAALMQGAIDKKAVDDRLAAVETTHESLLTIARDSVSRMRVALGGSASDLKALSAVEIVAEHSRLSAEFKAKFKVGGVAAVEPEQKSKGPAAAADHLHQARVAAVKSK